MVIDTIGEFKNAKKKIVEINKIVMSQAKGRSTPNLSII
jgi:hypothetical protein